MNDFISNLDAFRFKFLVKTILYEKLSERPAKKFVAFIIIIIDVYLIYRKEVNVVDTALVLFQLIGNDKFDSSSSGNLLPGEVVQLFSLWKRWVQMILQIDNQPSTNNGFGASDLFNLLTGKTLFSQIVADPYRSLVQTWRLFRTLKLPQLENKILPFFNRTYVNSILLLLVFFFVKEEWKLTAGTQGYIADGVLKK